MPKQCNALGCFNNVFGGGYCKFHQYHRKDKVFKPLKAVSDKRKAYKASGRTEIDVFNEIWEERPHVSELSGRSLPYDKSNMTMWVKQFLHVVNKGRSEDLRLNKRNIMLGTPDEHDHQDRYPLFLERKIEMLRKLYIPK